MKADRYEMAKLYKRIPKEAHKYIVQEMDWRSTYYVRQALLNDDTSVNRFDKIKHAFETWATTTGYGLTPKEKCSMFNDFETEAINGGTYELMQMSTETYKFLTLTKASCNA